MCILLEPAEIAANIRRRAKTQNVAVTILLQAQHIGVNRLREMETQGRYPRIDTMAKIAAYLGCTVDALIYRTEPEQAGDDQLME